MENEREWLIRINSPDPHERVLALEPVLKGMQIRLVNSLAPKLDSRQLAEDYVQEISIRACDAVENGRLDQITSPVDVEKFIWIIARNWLTDHYRRQGVHPTYIGYEEYLIGVDRDPDLTAWGVERGLLSGWDNAKLRNLCQYLPDEEAQISMLLFLSGFSFRQVSRLVPWSESTVRRHITNSGQYLSLRFDQEPEYVLLPGKQEHLLSFTDEKGFPGVSFFNADPKCFSGETAQMLCKWLGLQDIHQLRDLYIPFIIILKAYTEYATVRLSFLQRDDPNTYAFNGVPILYLDSIPTFAPDSDTGKWRKKERLWLDDVREFRAWIVDHNKPGEQDIEVFDWVYDLPDGALQLRKILKIPSYKSKKKRKTSLIQFVSRVAPEILVSGSQPTSALASS